MVVRVLAAGDEFRGPKQFVATGGGHHHSGFTYTGDLYRGLRMFWPIEAS